MTKSIILNGKKVNVNIIHTEDQRSYISENDYEMDIRAKEAVKAAIAKAKCCKKPVAKYDVTKKKVYIEYANGEIKYEE